MKDTESTSAAEAPAVAGRLDLGLGPLLDSWANAGGVQFASRSYGQYTTATVSRDGLLDLMRAVQAAERERWAALADAHKYDPAGGVSKIRYRVASGIAAAIRKA